MYHVVTAISLALYICMSPTLTRRAEIQRFERSNVVGIRDKISLFLYPGLTFKLIVLLERSVHVSLGTCMC